MTGVDVLIEQHIVHQCEEGNALPSNHAVFIEGSRRAPDDRMLDRRCKITTRRGLAFEAWCDSPNAACGGSTPRITYSQRALDDMRIGWLAACDNA